MSVFISWMENHNFFCILVRGCKQGWGHGGESIVNPSITFTVKAGILFAYEMRGSCSLIEWEVTSFFDFGEVSHFLVKSIDYFWCEDSSSYSKYWLQYKRSEVTFDDEVSPVWGLRNMKF